VGKADLHVHSACGDGMASVSQILEYADQKTDLSVVAVTDHDSLEGGFAAREAWAQGKYRVEVIPGEEVTTLQGHLIALFLEEPVASLRPLLETLEAVHRQGGLCIIPHPLNWLTRSIGHKTIIDVQRRRGSGIYFDGIQTANVAPGSRVKLKTAQRLNRERYHLPEVGGSDAHFLPAVGSAFTLFDGEGAEDLRRAILSGTTVAVNGHYPSIATIGYRQFLRQQWRGIAVTPKAEGWWPTIKSFLRRPKQ
jgi:predicted metal-dependent phosphoesterase TrpH